MPKLVAYLLLFLIVGVGFILVHLLVGKLIRPSKPHDEKLTIYECGEPTIGSAWIQFDVRFYVVALLFVIFDVEVAFFFPWAVVFGQTTELAKPGTELDNRVRITSDLTANQPVADPLAALAERKRELVAKGEKTLPAALTVDLETATAKNRRAAQKFALIAFFDILVFFGVLLLGYIYLWRRGDLQWVRTVEAQKSEEASAEPASQLAGAGV